MRHGHLYWRSKVRCRYSVSMLLGAWGAGSSIRAALGSWKSGIEPSYERWTRSMNMIVRDGQVVEARHKAVLRCVAFARLPVIRLRWSWWNRRWFIVFLFKIETMSVRQVLVLAGRCTWGPKESAILWKMLEAIPLTLSVFLPLSVTVGIVEITSSGKPECYCDCLIILAGYRKSSGYISKPTTGIIC